jgi:hypothetical protein
MRSCKRAKSTDARRNHASESMRRTWRALRMVTPLHKHHAQSTPRDVERPEDSKQTSQPWPCARGTRAASSSRSSYERTARSSRPLPRTPGVQTHTIPPGMQSHTTTPGKRMAAGFNANHGTCDNVAGGASHHCRLALEVPRADLDRNDLQCRAAHAPAQRVRAKRGVCVCGCCTRVFECSACAHGGGCGSGCRWLEVA